MVVRGTPGSRVPAGHRRGELSVRLRPVQSARLGPLPGPDRPDQPLQHALSDLLRQRGGDRPGLPAGLRPDRPPAANAARHEAHAHDGRPVHRRRADRPPGLRQDRRDGARHGLLAHPDRHQRPDAGEHRVRQGMFRRRPARVVSPVRRCGRGRLRRDAELPRHLGKEARDDRELSPARHEDLPRSHHPQGRHERPGRAHPRVRHRQHRRHQRDQLSAGLVHRADRPGRVGGPALHAGRPGPRHRPRRRRRPAEGHVPAEHRRAAGADHGGDDGQAEDPPVVPPGLRAGYVLPGLAGGQGLPVPAGDRRGGHVQRDECPGGKDYPPRQGDVAGPDSHGSHVQAQLPRRAGPAGPDRQALHSFAHGSARQERRARQVRRAELPHPAVRGHALPGPLQLRRRTRQAVRDPVLDPRGGLPVLHV